MVESHKAAKTSLPPSALPPPISTAAFSRLTKHIHGHHKLVTSPTRLRSIPTSDSLLLPCGYPRRWSPEAAAARRRRRQPAMADSDGEFVADDMSDDNLMDHTMDDDDEDDGMHDRASEAGAHSKARSLRTAEKAKSSRGRRRRRKAAAQTWEQSRRTWEMNLPDEDQDGLLDLTALEAEKRRRLLRDTTPLQRGIIRHVVLVLDMSFAMAEKDMLPTRYRLALGYAAAFVREFFEQNPISQLGIIGMRDGVAVRLSHLGGNPAQHLELLTEWEAQEPQGNPSLQNALEMCRGALLYVPCLALPCTASLLKGREDDEGPSHSRPVSFPVQDASNESLR